MSKYTAALQKIQEDKELKTVNTASNPPVFPNKIPAVLWCALIIVILSICAGLGYFLGTLDATKTGLAVLPEEKASVTALEPPVEMPSRYFTIQLITYQTEVKVMEEAVKLTAQGYRAFIKPNGNLFSVCVERFADKSEAFEKLSELKLKFGGKIYQDAFIHVVREKIVQA